MTERLLGYLASRFATSEENIATESLVWILRSELARQKLSALAGTLGVVLPQDLQFSSQVGHPETGIPDIVGADGQGRERLLLEAKFAAALTEQQPNGYLSRLPSDQPGLLLVVAPSVRLPTLWTELLHAIPSLQHSATAPSTDLPSGPLLQKVDDFRSLALISWRDLVTFLLDALQNAEEVGLAQDAQQLLALTEVMDSAAYAPLRPGDYHSRSARQIHQLQALIDHSHTRAVQGTRFTEAGPPSHGRVFYGWYLRTAVGQKRIWFGFLPREWDRKGCSPLWAWVNIEGSWSQQRILQALGPLGKTGGPGLFQEPSCFYIPLVIPNFASQPEAVADLLDQLERLGELLDATIEPGATVDQVEPEEDDGDAEKAADFDPF
jgi:hypothetical protein